MAEKVNVAEMLAAERARMQAELDGFFVEGAVLAVLNAERRPLGLLVLSDGMKILEVQVVRPDDYLYVVRYWDIACERDHVAYVDEVIKESDDVWLFKLVHDREVVGYLRANRAALTDETRAAVQKWRREG